MEKHLELQRFVSTSVCTKSNDKKMQYFGS